MMTATRPLLARRLLSVLSIFLLSACNGGSSSSNSTNNNNPSQPSISVSDVSVIEGDSGTQQIGFSVNLSASSAQTITVTYATADGTATADFDYQRANGTISFASGTTTQLVSVNVIGDVLDEADETFTLTLSNPGNATILDGSGTATINNDDHGPSLSALNALQVEGDSGSSIMGFQVSLSEVSGQVVTVDYMTSGGTATSGTDYESVSDTLSIPAGSTTASIDITINGDTIDEGNETVDVSLSNAGNAGLVTTMVTGTIIDDDAPATIGIDDPRIFEGDAGTSTIQFTVSLSAASGLPIQVDFTTQDGSAIAGSDYIASAGTLSFAPGEISLPIDITVNGDVVDEASESFLVVLGNAVNAMIADDTGVATIIDDDTTPLPNAVDISVTDALVLEGDAGTTIMTFFVNLSEASTNQVTVNFSTVAGSADEGVDYNASSGQVTFTPGDVSKPVTVTVIGDTIDEPDESLLLVLSAPVNGIIIDDTGVGMITDDDDPPTVSIADASRIEGNVGSANLSFIVSLSSASSQTITVDFNTVDGTALAGADYSATNGVVTFVPGDTSETLSVPILGDTLDEDSEQFTVTLSNPVNATPGDATGTGTINDDDDPASISIDSVSISEGNAGSTSLQFTVSLSEQSGKSITVDFDTTNGTAIAGTDYTASSGTLQFGAGVISQPVIVTVLGDSLDEPDESFTVNLSNAGNATIGGGSGIGTIIDDDVAPSLSISNASITEGDAGSVNLDFTVSLSESSGQIITVTFVTIDDTATAGLDYTATNGGLQFDPGDTVKTISVPVLGDTLDEAAEVFTVNLSAATNAIISDGIGDGTINDNDSQPALSINDVSINEGNAGSTDLVFTVSLSTESGRTITVDFATADGTATAGSDYTSTNGSLQIDPGSLSQTISVPVLGDAIDEPTESFTVVLNNATNATIADSSGTGTITDNDSTPSLSINDVSITEGNVGSANLVFTVSLSAQSGQTVTVDYATADATATAGSDYSASNGNTQFDPGETVQTISIAVLGDTIDEFAEAFAVNLSSAVNATISDNSGTGTINDNDGPPSVSINDASVAEGNAGSTNLVFTISLSAASGKDIDVDFATSNGTATAPGDYTATNGTAQLAAGQTTQLISVPVIGDILDEPDETFAITLSSPVNATLGDANGTGTISDDDNAVLISINDRTVTEGDAGPVTMSFTVSLNQASGVVVTVDYSTQGGSATADTDFTSAAGTVTFNPGDTSEPVDVTILGDLIDEASETFRVQLNNPGNAGILDGSGTGTITDNDPEPTLSISDESVTEADAGSTTMSFEVALSGQSGKTVTVAFATAGGTATSGTDFSANSGTVTFNAGTVTRNINVSITGDTLDENQEAFTVDLGNPSNASILDGSGTGTINDNDPLASLIINDVAISEGNSGSKNLAFTVMLSPVSGKNISVNYATNDGSATAGQDYTTTNGVLNFNAGTAQQTINVSILGDTDVEANETFTVDLSGASNATIGDASGQGTISDDDGAAGQPGLDSRPSNLTCIAPAAPDPGASITLTRVFQNAGGFSSMTAMVQIPGDNSQWYVLEKSGRVKRFANVANPSAATTVVDITGPVRSGPNEAGLLGIAFHPNFGQNGMPHNDEVFLSYTASGLVSRISRFTSSDGGITIDSNSEEILLTVDQPFDNHNGGTINFDPDGYLVAGFGDGGSGGDPNNNAQNTQNLLGTFIRIDVDNGSPYSIPGDNPFAGNQFCNANGVSPNSTSCPEIFAYGMRNPWKWSIDSQTGDFWAGDVGQDIWEEIDLIELGGNYGWRFREGAHCFNPANNCPTAGLIDPVAEYDQSNGDRTVIAGYVYRGSDVPDLLGVFIFGDTGTGRIWGLFDDGQGGLEIQELNNSPHTITTFAQDQNGEVYLNHYGSGAIYKINQGGGGGGTQTVPDNLSDTGCVLSNDPTTPESGLIPYDINALFWSDGAFKERWIAIPDGTTIAINGSDDFDFPIGTVIMKNFELNSVLVETRLFMRHTDGSWAGYSYEWNGAGTDATLVKGGKVKNINGQDYIYPSGDACLQCHTTAAGRALGPEVAQFNKDFLYVETGRTDNQLNTFDAIGMFTSPLPGDPDTLAKISDPFGADPLEDRARAYLHTNCSQCHRPGGPTPANMDLRYDTAFVDTNTCNVDPTSGDLGLNNPKLIAPGDPVRSMIINRMSRRDVHGMPPLGSNLVDAPGAQLLTDWVNSLAACP